MPDNKLTNAQQEKLNDIITYFASGYFSAADLKDKAGYSRSPSQTLDALANRYGILEKREDGTYRLLGAGEVMSTAPVAAENKRVSADAVSQLFTVRAKLNDEINRVFHWVDEVTYATDPNSLKGIYRIVEKSTGRILYIGQTGARGDGNATFTTRWAEHRKQLIDGNHHCKGLQTYFNETLNGNIDEIEFKIQESLPSDVELMNNREKYWGMVYKDTILNTAPLQLLPEEVMEGKKPSELMSKEERLARGFKVIVSDVASAIHEYLYSTTRLSDAEKATLIAGIVIALSFDNFKRVYRTFDDADFFIDQFMIGVNGAIKKYPGLKTGIESVQAEFNFIQHNPNFRKELVYGEEKYIALQFLTEIVEDSIYKIAEKYPTYDVLGDFYSEFTNRSGADQQSLGIVMTPRHVADFMGDLLEVTDDDIIMDICCGTGALLLAADNETRNKPNKMVGVEFQPRMMALTLANMIMRNADSTLIIGDSFDENILSMVKAEQPTKMIINPPYSQDGFPELGFVKRGLDQLAEGGIGVAIVPMSCAIKNDAKTKALKKAILDNHRLLGTFSMPDQLFYPVGVVTCVIVFQAHVADTEDSFFGYLKDDGFEITRTNGRMNTKGKWDEIKNRMLNLYNSNEAVAGLSATAFVESDDEWCCEAYMETDYSELNREDFMPIMYDYFSYLVKEGKINEIM